MRQSYNKTRLLALVVPVVAVLTLSLMAGGPSAANLRPATTTASTRPVSSGRSAPNDLALAAAGRQALRVEAAAVWSQGFIKASALAWIAAVAPQPVVYTVQQRHSSPVYYNSNPGAFLTCVKGRESGGNYSADNGVGYYGAYQFSQSTWDNTARQFKLYNLVGVRPNTADPATQDDMARKLYSWQGPAPWAGGRYRC